MLLIRAAASHQGIALVTETLARPELDQGGLVRVLDVAWPQEFAYWLVCPRATADQPKIVAFRDWLIEGGGQRARVQPGEQRGAERLEALVVHRRLRQRTHRLGEARRGGRAS